jgi:endonuclease/exonuclease/phosphatase family metal-dependent hydrolase
VRLRVLTFNVWNEEGDTHRIDMINREIHRLSPDLIAFQEVVERRGRNQLQQLIRGLNFHATHQTSLQAYVPPFADRFSGNAVATRWPHKPVELLDLRLAGVTDVPWATVAVVVELPERGEMLFIGATTSWRLAAESAREQQVVAIADLDARHRRKLPTVIAGDFNAAPDASSIRFLTGLQSLAGRSVHYQDAWRVAGDWPGYTWTVDNPNASAGIDQIVRQRNHHRGIDYVFIGSWDAHPNAYCRVEAATLALHEPVDGIWPSDHFGVVVDLNVSNDDQKSQLGSSN